MPKLKECPAITALNGALGVFSGLRRDTLADKHPATRHTSGLAVDIFFNSKNALENQHALELIDVLVKHQKAMKWSDLIYTNFHVGGGVGGYMGDGHTRYPWTGGGHDDHIHLDWVDRSLRTGPDGSPEFINNPYEHSDLSKRTEWLAALQADLTDLASSWASGGETPPAPSAPMPAWVAGWWRVVQEGDTYYYYFKMGGTVVWTYMRPANQASPMADPHNSGDCTATTSGALKIVWNEVGGTNTIETFRKTSPTSLEGSSNRGGPLVMTRV